MSRWLFDDYGNMLMSGSTEVACGLGLTSKSATAEEYAVENVGYVAVSRHKSTIHVRYRPAVVSERAIAALFYWLGDQDASPVAISWFDTIWRIERAKTIPAAISFMSYTLELRQFHSENAAGNRIAVRFSSKAERRWLSARPVLLALAADPASEPAFHAELDRLFAGRWSILGVDTASDDVTIRRQGSGYPPLDPAFRVNGGSDGYRLDQITDQNYADWVAATALETAILGRPRFEDVDAIVDWPRFGDMRTRYWRFVIPLATAGSLCRLLTVSGNDTGIDLRPKNVEKAANGFAGIRGSHPEQSGLY